jgi:triosephosphate isomerase
MKKHSPLIIGNWKMNPMSSEKADILCKELLKALGKKGGKSEVGICPPSLFVALLSKRLKGSAVALGAQDISSEKEGAHTGELSSAMLKLLGVTHAIVGHSERRAQGESDLVVSKKALAGLSSGLTTIVCVGEKARDGHGHYFNEIESQLKSLFALVEKKHLGKLVIAYEPIWAIGTGKTASVEDVHEMKLFIQKIIAETYERAAISKVRIIYGGSVNKDNARSLCEGSGMNGFLVGGASLKPAEFAEIVRISNNS